MMEMLTLRSGKVGYRLYQGKNTWKQQTAQFDVNEYMVSNADPTWYNKKTSYHSHNKELQGDTYHIIIPQLLTWPKVKFFTVKYSRETLDAFAVDIVSEEATPFLDVFPVDECRYCFMKIAATKKRHTLFYLASA